MRNEFKPCPFCGYAVMVTMGHDGHAAMQHKNKSWGCPLDPVLRFPAANMRAATLKWNQRTGVYDEDDLR